MRDRRYVDDLTIQELEEELLIRRREERLARVRRIRGSHLPAEPMMALGTGSFSSTPIQIPGGFADEAVGQPASGGAKSAFRLWRDRILLGVEIAALVGLVVVVVTFVANVQRLNRDWKAQQATDPLPAPTATALIRVAILPGGHKPPTTRGGEAEPLGAVPKVAVPTPGPRSPTRLVIPALDVDVPVVEGVDWEQLKKGAGHLVGSAAPGERGNCFIAGHNDVYGEIFRDLEELKIGDEISVYSGKQLYRYIVRATRIVEPDDVSVMYPTSTPVLTLLTCYPYMVDSHRLVVIAELDR